MTPLASLGDDISNFFGAVGDFFGRLAEIQIVPLLIGLIFFGVYLTIRSRAYFNVLRAAYPDERFEFRKVWGAYMAAYGFNNVVPARGGDVIKLFLVRTSIPNSSYPAIGSSFFVEAIFDLCMAVPILAFAFTQGAFPKPPDFSKLGAFDLSYLAAHPQFTLFLLIGAGLYVFYGLHPTTFSSADRIFPTFIVREMPIGIAGLLIAAIPGTVRILQLRRAIKKSAQSP